jgi:hypothetical protein
LISLGVLVSFVAMVSYIVFAATPLRFLGVPPPDWFGSDYTDPRGAFVSGGFELFVLGVISFFTAVVLNRRFAFSSRLDAFWLCNPVSAAFGLVAVHQLFRNVPEFIAPEFTAPVVYLLLVAWPVGWHLAVIGFRRASPAKAVVLSAAYAVAFGAFGLFRVHRTFLLS